MSCATAKMRNVMPPTFIRLPARMKNGMASNGNEVVEAYMRCATMISRVSPPCHHMIAIAVSARLMAIGTPIIIRTISRAKIVSVSMLFAARGFHKLRPLVPRSGRHVVLDRLVGRVHQRPELCDLGIGRLDTPLLLHLRDVPLLLLLDLAPRLVSGLYRLLRDDGALLGR